MKVLSNLTQLIGDVHNFAPQLISPSLADDPEKVMISFSVGTTGAISKIRRMSHLPPQTSDAEPLGRHWRLEPGRIFVNHGSYGATPRRVSEYQTELQQQLEHSPSHFMAGLPARLQQARERLAEFLRARPEQLAWLTNTTSGVNAVLRSVLWRPGDQVVMTDHVYNACYNVVSFLQQRYGVEPVVVRLPYPDSFTVSRDSSTVCQSILAALTERTRLAMVCHVSSPTALIFPLEAMAEALHQRGVPLLVDGAHAPGMVALDLEHFGERGLTYYVGNLHKWCCSPKGAAFLWAAKSAQTGLHPAVISHGWNSERPESRFQAEFDWCGTFDPTAWLAAPESLDLLAGLYPGGWEELRASCQARLLQGRRAVAAALAPQPLPDPSWLGQMASLEIPASDPEALYRTLYDEFGIDVWLSRWQRRTLLRISAAPYNTEDDYHRLAAALLAVQHRKDPLWS